MIAVRPDIRGSVLDAGRVHRLSNSSTWSTGIAWIVAP